MERVRRVELPTLCLASIRSSQLSYTRIFIQLHEETCVVNLIQAGEKLARLAIVLTHTERALVALLNSALGTRVGIIARPRFTYTITDDSASVARIMTRL